MDKEKTGLSRALVGIQGFVWEPGLKAGRQRIDGQDPEGRPVRYESYYDEWDDKEPYKKCACYAGDNTPDLTDPGTGGILLDALGPGWVLFVDEAPSRGPAPFCLVGHDGERTITFSGKTLAAACARALVARGWYRREG